MNQGTVYAIDPLQDARWARLVERDSVSSVFHSTEWLSALHSAYQYRPVVYSFCEPGGSLTSGMVFCQIDSRLTGRRLVSLPFSDHCDALVANDEEFDALSRAVAHHADREKLEYCEVRPVRFGPEKLSPYTICNSYAWHSVDLSPNNERIFSSFHKSVQRKIRRAEREQLRYEEGNSEEFLRIFYKLLVTTRRRQHLPPQPIRWFRSLISAFGAKLKIRVAFKGTAPIASILTLTHKNSITYKYGCSDARFHPLGGMALLFWKTIQEAKAAGNEKFDLGRTEKTNLGLTAYKERWSGVCSELSYWRYPHRLQSRDGVWTRRIATGVIKVSPDRVLVAIGNVLYKHIG